MEDSPERYKKILPIKFLQQKVAIPQRAESTETMVCQMRSIIKQMYLKRPNYLDEVNALAICPNNNDRLYEPICERYFY